MKEFYVEIDNLVRENPEYTRDEAFTFWFINYLILDEKKADSSLTGASGDKGIDALWIDDEAKTINILQAKFTKFRTRLSELLDADRPWHQREWQTAEPSGSMLR